MLSFLADLVFGGILSIALFVLGLFPSVNVGDFACAAPQSVRDALGALNWFVPVADLMSIFGVWLALVLVANAVMLFRKFTDQAGRYLE